MNTPPADDLPATLRTPSQLSERFGINPESFRRWARGGRLTMYRIGHRILLDESEVVALVRVTKEPAQ
jgi:predicted site-specific integrase-resolvase